MNTLKSSVEEVRAKLDAQGWKMHPVPWSDLAFWVEHVEGRRDIGNTVEHMLGYYYVQEPASMLPPLVLGVKPGEVVLDMAASPGSKTTQIAAMMENTGLLVANDYKGLRLAALGLNVQRLGLTNIVISLQEGRHFDKTPETFDKILVDAPCSGTGTIRKSLKTITIWNPNMVKRLAATQKQLIEAAFIALKPGGEMVYSTCSNEPEEDEGVISFLLEKYPGKVSAMDIDVQGLKTSNPVMNFSGKEFHPDVSKTLRIWPQDNDTEGFFVAKLKKKE